MLWLLLQILSVIQLFVVIYCSKCPTGINIEPCVCTESNDKSTLICRGQIGLTRLTTVLRNDLCNQTIDQFWLIEADIGYLPSNLFYKVRVKDIQVSFTNISHFTEAGRSAFYGLERHLVSLSMRRCSLVNGLKWEKIGDLSDLTHLDLSFNDLTEVPWVWFRHPPMSLRSLHLKGNKIVTLHNDSLSSLHNLVELDLSENLISIFDRNVLPYPGNNLIFLRLSYNRIEKFPENFFAELFGLRRLYLDNNFIQTLEERVWSPIWGELQLLDLSGNPIRCDCEAYWAAKLYPPPHLYAKCGYFNSTMDGKNIKDLFPWDFNCEDEVITSVA